jgi:hypothetical protein
MSAWSPSVARERAQKAHAMAIRRGAEPALVAYLRTGAVAPLHPGDDVCLTEETYTRWWARMPVRRTS